MNIRPRYFIETKNGLFFAVNSYHHTPEHIISFLRYIPCNKGNRTINNQLYCKVNSDKAYKYLIKKYPNYLFEGNIKGKKSMGVPIEDIKKVYNPIEILKNILNEENSNNLHEKIKLLAKCFHDKVGIDYDHMGITGSCILGLDTPKSDIDFIIFGLDNHKCAREFFGRVKNDPNYILNSVSDDYWLKVYNKRIFDDILSFDEFKWYENRKNNRGLIKGTLFDILSTMNYEEINQDISNLSSVPVEKIIIKCQIKDDSQSYDTPSIYLIENVEILKGTNINIEKIICYTHTYAGEVKNNEWVIASGVLEKVYDKQGKLVEHTLIIGTTREAKNEYIKLEKIKL